MPNIVGMSMAGSTPTPSMGNPQAQGFFSGSGFNDFTSGLRNVTRNFAAGFAKDPAVRQQAGQTLAMEEQQKQAEKRDMIAQSFERMKTLAASIQGVGTVPPALGRYIEKEAEILAQISGDPQYAQQMRDYAFTLAQMPREQGEGFSLSPGQQRFDAAGNVIAEVPESSNLLSPEEEEQKIRIGVATRAPGTTINIDAKPISEGQAASLGFADRAQNAENIVADLSRSGYQPSGVEETLGNIPGVGNYLISDSKRRHDSAKLDFITAVLRKESGAAISEDEFAREDEKYFPQPNDDEATLADKAARRAQAIANLRREGRPVTAGEAKEETTEQPKSATSIPSRPANVPMGSAYSPSRRQWKTPDGIIYDESGNLVSQ